MFYRLEAEGFECVLADARQAKNLPGRPKRDPSDSRWLAACFERGAVTGCFVATPEFRLIREHTRYRRDLTGERTREKQRAEKLLESAAVKLSSVVTDLHAVTGRDIMDHLIAGERNPRALAQLARARARRKIGEAEEALDGAEFFTPEHAALLEAMLARIDRINEEIARLSQVIERLLASHEDQLQQAESMPGWGRRAADSGTVTGPGGAARPPGELEDRPEPAFAAPGELTEQPGPPDATVIAPAHAGGRMGGRETHSAGLRTQPGEPCAPPVTAAHNQQALPRPPSSATACPRQARSSSRSALQGATTAGAPA